MLPVIPFPSYECQSGMDSLSYFSPPLCDSSKGQQARQCIPTGWRLLVVSSTSVQSSNIPKKENYWTTSVHPGNDLKSFSRADFCRPINAVECWTIIRRAECFNHLTQMK